MAGVDIVSFNLKLTHSEKKKDGNLVLEKFSKI